MGPRTAAADNLHGMKFRGRGEDYREACNREAVVLKDNDEHYHQYRELRLDMRFLPGGRVQSSIGSLRQTTAFNCFVSGTIADSFVEGKDSIMMMAVEAAATMRMGGGIGYDWSTLRPRGALIKKLGHLAQSSGPTAFMRIYNEICLATSSAGHRRGAQMGVLRVDHPDIEEFILAKQNNDQLRGFNLSIAVTDEFMKAALGGKDFDLRFGDTVYSTVNAAELYERIMRSTFDWAEPGIIFIDRINEMNNLRYCETIAATNPCVSGDTEILTDRGYEEIQNLVDQSVTIWNGEEWSIVTPRNTGADQPTLEISFSDGSSLRCTPGHKFLLQNDTRVDASTLSIGSKLLKHSWPVIGVQEQDFDIIGYTQGFFAGDGWEDKRGRQYVGLYLQKKDVEGQLSQDYISKRAYKSKDGTGRIYLYYGRDYFRPKTYVPDVSQSLLYRLSWLSGLVDSDGHLTRDSNLQISSKDRDFLYNVKMMLNTIGVSGTLSPMKDCWRLSIPASYTWDLVKLGLQTNRVHGYKEPDREARPYVFVTDVRDGEVAEKVYCFTEGKRHSGIFGGVLTGNCGEQPLPPYGACLLGSFNLPRYLKNNNADHPNHQGPAWYFDYDQFLADIPVVVRAMDNVTDRTRYPLAAQKAEAISKRRMGLGITGLANAAEACGFVYGSIKFVEFEKKILQILMIESYRTSTVLAKEKGAFPYFDSEKYLDGLFIQKLPEDVRHLISKHGIRNSHLTSIAPTGTISMTADNVSSSIEPVFSYRTERPINTPDGPSVEVLEDYGAKFLSVQGKLCHQVTAAEHVGVLITAQQYVDSAVAKTINMDGEIMEWGDFKKIYSSAWEHGAKGCTTFNISGKRMALLKTVKDEEGQICKIDSETGRRECA